MLGENRGDPDPYKDITLSGEEESVRTYLKNPLGIWSDSEMIMWVSASVDKKI